MEQLHIGQVLKNFKELCAILEIPYEVNNNKGGKQKILAEKKARQFVEFEKVEHSHRIVITEIKSI